MNWNTVKKVIKWAGIALGGLVGVIVIALVVLYFLGGLRVNKIHDIQVAAITVPTDGASIERGKHIIETRVLCQECHDDNLGGKVLEDDPIFGRFAPPNLTSGEGGLGGSLSDIDYVRAIRHGVRSDGKAIFLMPSEIYNKIGDEDLGAVIAYLKSLPPIDNEIPESKARLGLRVLAVLERQRSTPQPRSTTMRPGRPLPSPVLPASTENIWPVSAPFVMVTALAAACCRTTKVCALPTSLPAELSAPGRRPTSSTRSETA